MNKYLLFAASLLMIAGFVYCRSSKADLPEYHCGKNHDLEKQLLKETLNVNLDEEVNAIMQGGFRANIREELDRLEKKYHNNCVAIPAYTEYIIGVDGY